MHVVMGERCAQPNSNYSLRVTYMTSSLMKPGERVHTTIDVLFDLHSQVSASLPILSPGKLDLALMIAVP